MKKLKSSRGQCKEDDGKMIECRGDMKERPVLGKWQLHPGQRTEVVPSAVTVESATGVTSYKSLLAYGMLLT
jgi:hypothetical protein